MLNSDLNSLVALQNNNPEVFNKEYYIVEREKDGVIKHVHAVSKEGIPRVEYIKIENGRIFLAGRSYLDDVVALVGYSQRGEFMDYLETMSDMRSQPHNVTKVSTFEVLDLNKIY